MGVSPREYRNSKQTHVFQNYATPKVIAIKEIVLYQKMQKDMRFLLRNKI